MASRAVAASLSGAIRAQPALRARGNTRRSARHAVRLASRHAPEPARNPQPSPAPDFTFRGNRTANARGVGDGRCRHVPLHVGKKPPRPRGARLAPPRASTRARTTVTSTWIAASSFATPRSRRCPRRSSPRERCARERCARSMTRERRARAGDASEAARAVGTAGTPYRDGSARATATRGDAGTRRRARARAATNDSTADRAIR